MTEDEKSDRKSQAQELKKKGNQFYLAGENEDAINQYNQGLEICPLCFSEDRSILMANKAAALIKMDQKVEAIEQCSEAIQLNPKYVKALLRRGQTYEETDKPHEAMKDFQQVLEIDPTHKEARMAVMRLPEKIKEKDEKLKEEMMSKWYYEYIYFRGHPHAYCVLTSILTFLTPFWTDIFRFLA